MELTSLSAISPIDGRYRNQTQSLAPYFSEFGLIKYRVQVEIEYLLFLAEKKIYQLPKNIKAAQLRAIYLQFNETAAQQIKTIERVTNHDVKAVEYYIKEQLDALGAEACKEWVHFGLTSQDINNTAIPLLWKEALELEFLPSLENVLLLLKQQAQSWNTIPMLARTHGQSASPTNLGKEWFVFVERLRGQINLLSQVPYAAKFGGATGNFNAHHVAFPHIDWIKFGNEFVTKKLGLERMQFTTQIEHYDNLSAQFDALKRINTILIDFSRDVWTYISMDYFKQKVKAGEVGSSAMPHKVNPIDFENSEGNLGVANALLRHLAEKLPISRWQRDLTDSTVLRNLGPAFGHSVLAYDSALRGLGKLEVNHAAIAADLDACWEVLAEPVQTVMRRYGIENPYEQLKELTRGKCINQADLQNFIRGLKIPDDAKTRLLEMTPSSYLGKAVELTERLKK